MTDGKVDGSNSVTSPGMSMETLEHSDEEQEKTSEVNDPVTFDEKNSPDKPTTSVDTMDNLTSKPYAFIDPANGTCVSCNDSEAIDSSLICMFCLGSFHAVCRNLGTDKSGTDVICSRSFYKNYVQVIGDGVYSSRPGNFPFVCDVCQTNFEINRVATQDKKVDKIDRRVDSLIKSISEIKTALANPLQVKPTTPSPTEDKINKIDTRLDKLSESVDTIIKVLETNAKSAESLPHPLEPPNSYANAVKAQRSVVVIDGCDNTPDKLGSLIADSGARVDKSFVSKKDGSSVVVCRTKEDRTNLEKKLKEKFPGAKTHHPPELMPTISVANLRHEYSPDDLKTAILTDSDINKLVQSGGIVNVLSVKPHRKDESRYQATIRVSGNVRQLISSLGDRLYFNSASYPVFDHFHVKRCNRCQRLNHYKLECKANTPTCGYCSDTHESTKCPHLEERGFYPNCVNCKNNHKTSSMHTHDAFSMSCPSYVAEQNKLRKSIDYNYSSQNQKN